MSEAGCHIIAVVAQMEGDECPSPTSSEGSNTSSSTELTLILPSTPSTTILNSPSTSSASLTSPISSLTLHQKAIALTYAIQPPLSSPPTSLSEDGNSDESPENECGVTPFALTCYIETWSKIRDISDAIGKAAVDCLAGRGYNVKIPQLEADTVELLKSLKKAGNSNVFAEERSDSKQKLPPPLVRPRRHRRKKNIEVSIDEDDNVFTEESNKRKNPTDLYCHSCGTTDTPEWRRGPDGCKSLCNACGLHYAKILKRETMVPNRQTQKNTMSMNNLLN